MPRTRAFKAGVARANITPPVGIQLCGFAGRGPSIGLGDDLYATALVVGDASRRAAIVACDLIDLPLPFAEKVFAEVARRTRIPAQNIVLCCSHTHYGPETRTYEGDSENSDLVAYMAGLKFRLAGAIQEANANLRPVVASVARGVSDIGINRRERRPDGAIVLGRNPGGPIDREVIVLRLDRPNGEPLACVVNFQAHAVSQTSRGRLISADFPGPARDVVEQLTGAKCLYIQGACGNINSVIMQVGLETPRTLGKRLGASVVQAYEVAEPAEVAP
ncbi:MAG: neutral/alkaline non-lysosomal ceramidase N-terminal domain-containing protein, partial [Armatimonadota bacterium]